MYAYIRDFYDYNAIYMISYDYHVHMCTVNI